MRRSYHVALRFKRAGEAWIDKVIFAPKPLLINPTHPSTHTGVSIVIPTLNGAHDLQTLFTALKPQLDAIGKSEIIIVDSGSSDATLAYAQSLGAHIIHLSPTQFSHDHARNLGVAQAKHEYVLLMTQDAVPQDTHWLAHSLKAMQNNPNIVALSYDETPQADADLFARVSWWHHLQFLGVTGRDCQFGLPIWASNKYIRLRRHSHLSNVACLIRRDIALRYPFQRHFAEDLDLGVRLIKAGHQLGFISSSPVIHSHNRSLQYVCKRSFVDSCAMRNLFADFPLPRVSQTVTAQQLITLHEQVVAWCDRLQAVPPTHPTPTPALKHYLTLAQADLGDLTEVAQFKRDCCHRLTLAQQWQHTHPAYQITHTGVNDFVKKSSAALTGAYLAAAYLHTPKPNDAWQEVYETLHRGV